MHLIKLTRIALSSLLKNRTRSVLTMLGIIIGVAAVIVMVAIGQGAQETVRENIGALGTNVIMVFPGANMFGGVSRGAGTGNPLEMDDVEALREQSTLLAAVSPAAHSGAQVIGAWATGPRGSAASRRIPDGARRELASGVFFTERQMRARAKVCVLGDTVSTALYPGADPVGQTLRIRNVPFTVIGVLARKGRPAGAGIRTTSSSPPSIPCFTA
jgi:putative ABC transport system permease protein